MKQAFIIMICLMAYSSLFAQTEEKKDEGDKIQEVYMKANKENIDAAKPLIDFLLKYDEKDSTKAPDQNDFDQLLNQMGVMDELKNDKSGLTKEDAFQFINAYINADKNIGKQEATKPSSDTESELQKELKKAEKLFEDSMPEIEKLMKEAEKEAEKIKTNPNLIPYGDFRKKAKQMKPELSESEIKAAYDDLMKTLGNTH